MTDRYEKSIENWYKHSRTVDLEWLDLETKQVKIKNSDIFNNLSCVYDRLSLHAKISIKDFYELKSILENKFSTLESEVSDLKKSSRSLHKELGLVKIELVNNKPSDITYKES